MVFFPTAAQKSQQTYTFVCDNCQVKDFSIQGKDFSPKVTKRFSIRSQSHFSLFKIGMVCVLGSPGEGQLVALQFVSAEKELPEVGEVHDVTAEHYVRFDACNPHSVLHKTLVIRNNV